VYAYDLAEVYGAPLREHVGHVRAYRTRMEETLRLVAGVAASSARILDVAAAQGNYTLALAERGHEVTWNDIRAELAGYVELKRESGIVRYRPGDVFSLDEEAAYDVVLATEIIEHVAHPDAFLDAIARLVKPGGHVVLTTPNGGFFRNRQPKFSTFADPARYESEQFQPDAAGHIFLLHFDEVEPLAIRAGLEVVELRLFNNFLTAGWAATGRLARRVPDLVVDRLEQWTRKAPLAVQRKIQTHLACVCRRPGANDAARIGSPALK
jgi:2-polyprenyl-3-methyl-5-hydroxy-6-metoxy-1,4-benzoquinol methylase